MRKIKQITAIVLAAAMVITVAPASSSDASKKLKLSKKTATVTVGRTVKIKLKNAKKKTKVKWKTSKASVASIVKKKTKGKKACVTVKGNAAGKAKITAVYKAGKKNKKLVCKVTVKGSDSIQPVNSPAPTNGTVIEIKQTATPPVTNTTAPAEETKAPVSTRKPTASPSPKPTATPVPSPDAQIYKINKDIDIDGVVDSAWDFADAMPINNWTADDDTKKAQTSNSAAKMLWTDKYFYVLVTADDPELDFGNKAPYYQDSIELFFDEHNYKQEYGKNNEFQYRLICNPEPVEDEQPIGKFTEKSYWDGEDVEYAVSKTETGYACEFAIPLNEAPVENQFAGVEIQINDASGGERNGTWNLFANPADGEDIPYDNTAVFGDCQYVIKREAKVIELTLDSEYCNMEKPDQFKTDPEGKWLDMNTKSRIDDENKWVYCNTANNLTVYFPEGRTVVEGEKAEVKVKGTYTPAEEADGDILFRMWMADSYNRELKGDSPITQSNKIINELTKGWLTGQADENGDFTIDFTLIADGGEKASEVIDENGETVVYEPRGIADALMIKAPSYDGMIGDIIIKSVVITVYDPIEYVEPGGDEPEPDASASPDATQKPNLAEPYEVDLSKVSIVTDGVPGGEPAKVTYNEETKSLDAAMPGMQGFIVRSPITESKDDYKYVEITYTQDGEDVGIFAGQYDAGTGQGATGWSPDTNITKLDKDKETTLLLSSDDYLEGAPLGSIKIFNYGGAANISIKSITFYKDGAKSE